MRGKVLSNNTNGRFVMDRPYRDDHLTPEQRLAEHKASKQHTGPDPHTTRLQLRAKMGNEAPLVRAMHDRTTKPRRRRK